MLTQVIKSFMLRKESYYALLFYQLNMYMVLCLTMFAKPHGRHSSPCHLNRER